MDETLTLVKRARSTKLGKLGHESSRGKKHPLSIPGYIRYDLKEPGVAGGQRDTQEVKSEVRGRCTLRVESARKDPGGKG